MHGASMYEVPNSLKLAEVAPIIPLFCPVPLPQSGLELTQDLTL